MFREGKTVSCGWVLFRAARAAGKETRFACAIRRGALPKAVQRNRVKRWLREAYRRRQREFPPGLDLVALVTRAPAEWSYLGVEQTLRSGCERLQRTYF